MIALYAALLVVWGNVVSTTLGATAWLPGGSWAFVAAGLGLTAISLAVARALRLDARALGLAREHVLRGALIGGIVAAAAAAASVVAVRVVAPLIVGRDVDYAPLRQVTESDLLPHLVVLLPLGDIIPEEFAFRGVLLGALAQGRGPHAAVAVSAAVFGLWHGAVAFRTVGDTTLGSPSPWFLPAVADAAVAVVAGGAILAWLRLRTGSLATTIAAHWVFNAALLAGLWSTRSSATSVCC